MLVREMEAIHQELEALRKQRSSHGGGGGITDQRTFQISMFILQGLLIPWLIWLTLVVGNIRQDVAILRENRYTISDGIRLRGDVNRLQSDVLEIQEELDLTQDRLEDHGHNDGSR